MKTKISKREIKFIAIILIIGIFLGWLIFGGGTPPVAKTTEKSV